MDFESLGTIFPALRKVGAILIALEDLSMPVRFLADVDSAF
jgi:hypothetical protein